MNDDRFILSISLQHCKELSAALLDLCALASHPQPVFPTCVATRISAGPLFINARQIELAPGNFAFAGLPSIKGGLSLCMSMTFIFRNPDMNCNKDTCRMCTYPAHSTQGPLLQPLGVFFKQSGSKHGHVRHEWAWTEGNPTGKHTMCTGLHIMRGCHAPKKTTLMELAKSLHRPCFFEELHPCTCTCMLFHSQLHVSLFSFHIYIYIYWLHADIHLLNAPLPHVHIPIIMTALSIYTDRCALIDSCDRYHLPLIEKVRWEVVSFDCSAYLTHISHRHMHRYMYGYKYTYIYSHTFYVCIYIYMFIFFCRRSDRSSERDLHGSRDTMN